LPNKIIKGGIRHCGAKDQEIVNFGSRHTVPDNQNLCSTEDDPLNVRWRPPYVYNFINVRSEHIQIKFFRPQRRRMQAVVI